MIVYIVDFVVCVNLTLQCVISAFAFSYVVDIVIPLFFDFVLIFFIKVLLSCEKVFKGYIYITTWHIRKCYKNKLPQIVSN